VQGKVGAGLALELMDVQACWLHPGRLLHAKQALHVPQVTVFWVLAGVTGGLLQSGAARLAPIKSIAAIAKTLAERILFIFSIPVV
jgi:hypothetical protein